MHVFGLLAAARNLRDIQAKAGAEGGHNNMFKPNQGEEQLANDDSLATMDYTPAKKNPPIHN